MSEIHLVVPTGLVLGFIIHRLNVTHSPSGTSLARQFAPYGTIDAARMLPGRVLPEWFSGCSDNPFSSIGIRSIGRTHSSEE